jgi:hypothetical protein
MYLTVNCPGWLRQSSLLPPEPETEASKEGEAGHEIAALAASCHGWTPAGRNIASNGVEITQDMLDGAARWVEALEGFPAHIETPVQIRRLHPTDCWGTPDARQWSPDPLTLRLADYKFGFEYVDEFENWQLLAYAIGALDELFPEGSWVDRPGITVEMTVVQPRFYSASPIRTWTIRTAGLLHYTERMREAIRQADSAEPPLKTGPHCTHCPARTHCPAYDKAFYHAIDFAGRADPMVATPEQVGRELSLVREFVKRLEARETGLAAVAESMIRTGKNVPGWALEQSAGRLAWTQPLEVVEGTARMLGKSLLKPPELITPTQAKDRKLLDAKVIDQYAARPNGAFKLTPHTNKSVRSKFA